MARCVWALEEEEVTEHLHCSEERDARSWLAAMVETLKHDGRVWVVVTLWSIWHARRKAIHEQQYQSPLSVHCFVNQFVADLEQSRTKAEKKKTPSGGELGALDRAATRGNQGQR
jgi:hypothetical protein